jgi:hypothetical protein
MCDNFKCLSRVSLFRFKKKRCETKQNEAKKMRNKTLKTWLTFRMFLFGLEVFLGVHVCETKAISLRFA